MKPGDLDLFNPDTFSEGPPHDYFRMLRKEAPVCWTPPPKPGVKCISGLDTGYWVLSRYEDLVDVSRSPRTFSSAVKTAFLMDADAESLPGLQAMLINMDPPSHVKYRRLVQRGFTPRMVRDLEPVIRRHARRVVDDVAGKGHCEFVNELACELPMTLICELAGIPEKDRQQIFHWSNQLIGADDPDMSEGIDPGKASTEMWIYANNLAEEKRQHPDGTLISKYVNGEVNGEKISQFELNNFFVLLCVAGNETTRNATSQFMRLMSEHPEAWKTVVSDVDRYLPLAIEEALRFAPPVLQFCRIALHDTAIRGIPIAKGERVYLSYPSANRDEEVWDDPDRFDVTRDPNPHITFGIGEHFCLGANLARMQLRCVLREVATRLPDIHATAPPKLQRSNMIDGIKEMQVAFTPES